MRLRLQRRPERVPAPAGAGPVILVLPARDEAPRIGTVIDRLARDVLGRPTRCIVVDDASTDGTAAIAAGRGATVVRHERRRGLGAAVRTGLRAAVDVGAAVVAFCDADGEYDPAQLAALAAPIVEGRADYVVGSRFAGSIERMLLRRRLGNRVLTLSLRLIAREPITDGQSGYRALSARAAAEAEIVHDYNYAQVLTLDLLGRGFRYAEVPITYSFRDGGRSFVRLGHYLRAVGPAVWRTVQASARVNEPAPAPGSQPDHR
jgi:glycosyltransferase involved in cell wall biosynthesis